MPSLFEFNTDLLLFLAENLFSCKYGTFLLNNPNERTQCNTAGQTVSIWLEVNLKKREFTNAYFNQELTAEGGRVTRVPKTDYYQLRVWREFFQRYTDEPIVADRGDKQVQLDTKARQVFDLKEKLENLLSRTRVLTQNTAA